MHGKKALKRRHPFMTESHFGLNTLESYLGQVHFAWVWGNTLARITLHSFNYPVRCVCTFLRVCKLPEYLHEWINVQLVNLSVNIANAIHFLPPRVARLDWSDVTTCVTSLLEPQRQISTLNLNYHANYTYYKNI